MTEYPIKTPQQLGAVLKGYRRQRQLTQLSAGSQAGLAQNAISEIEANPGPTSWARIFKVLAALDLEIVVRPRQGASSKAEW